MTPLRVIGVCCVPMLCSTCLVGDAALMLRRGNKHFVDCFFETVSNCADCQLLPVRVQTRAKRPLSPLCLPADTIAALLERRTLFT